MQATEEQIWTTRDGKKIAYADLTNKHLVDLVHMLGAQAYMNYFVNACKLAAKVISIEPGQLEPQIADNILAEVFSNDLPTVMSKLDNPHGSALLELAIQRKAPIDPPDLHKSCLELIQKSKSEAWFFYYADRLETRVTEEPI